MEFRRPHEPTTGHSSDPRRSTPLGASRLRPPSTTRQRSNDRRAKALTCRSGCAFLSVAGWLSVKGDAAHRHSRAARQWWQCCESCPGRKHSARSGPAATAVAASTQFAIHHPCRLVSRDVSTPEATSFARAGPEPGCGS